jgi:hypothetical protein
MKFSVCIALYFTLQPFRRFEKLIDGYPYCRHLSPRPFSSKNSAGKVSNGITLIIVAKVHIFHDFAKLKLDGMLMLGTSENLAHFIHGKLALFAMIW